MELRALVPIFQELHWGRRDAARYCVGVTRINRLKILEK